MRHFEKFSGKSAARVQQLVDLTWSNLSDHLHLIASACYPFPEVISALSEPVFVFPVEGLPGKRYFPGTLVMDEVEIRSEQILQKLFNVGDSYGATVQPHSGTQANQIVYNAVLKPNDVVLSLSPSDGGHISHKVLVGRRNPVHFYPLDSGGIIDYCKLAELAKDLKPKLIIAGASSYPHEIDFAKISTIAKESKSYLHADVSHTGIFILGGIHRPVSPYADFISFNMMKNLRGPNGGVLLFKSRHAEKISSALFPGTQGGPNENTMLAKYAALERLVEFDLTAFASRIVEIARLLASTLVNRAVDVVGGGTDNHQIVIDLRSTGKTGAEVEQILESHRVLVNRNAIPGDRQKPWITSGLRLGSTCLAILDYENSDIVRLGNWLADQIHGCCSEKQYDLIPELTQKYHQQLVSLRHEKPSSAN